MKKKILIFCLDNRELNLLDKKVLPIPFLWFVGQSFGSMYAPNSKITRERGERYSLSLWAFNSYTVHKMHFRHAVLPVMAISKFSFKILQQNSLLTLQWDTFHNYFKIITNFTQDDAETQNNPSRVIKNRNKLQILFHSF